MPASSGPSRTKSVSGEEHVARIPLPLHSSEPLWKLSADWWSHVVTSESPGPAAWLSQ